MATLEELGAALKGADAAGDVEAASALAGAIRQMQGVERPRVVVTPEPSWTETAADAAKSAGVGVAKGVIGLVGLPGAASDALAAGTNYMGNKAAEFFGGQAYQLPEKSKTLNRYVPTPADIQTFTEQNVTGEFRKPETRIGEYAQTIGEFIPGAMLGPGGVVRNAAVFGVVPGTASELAGGYTKGTELEPFARGAAAIGTGVLGAIATAPSAVSGLVSRAAGGADRAAMQQAELLFQEAQAAGMPITRAEAIQFVTNGSTNMGNMQRVVEGQGGLREFYSGRRVANEAAAGRTFDQITPAAPNPSAIGPAVGTAAETTVNDVRGAINTASEPFYQAASPQRIDPATMAQIRAHPSWAEARAAVRNDPQLNRNVANLPDDSVGFLNEVKKYTDNAAENASSAVNAQRNQQRAAGYTQDAAAFRTAAENASPEYAQALAIQRHGRETYLQPLLDGPIGRIASKDTTTQKAIDVLFPRTPLPNSAQEIETAVRAASQRNAYAARNLVRAHLEMEFNASAGRLARTDGSTVGAGFWKAVAGDPQQRMNLEAAVRGLPNGDNIWPGVERFLTILEAQSHRQAIGSQTAFNQEGQQALRRGNFISETGATVATGGFNLPRRMREGIENWRMGRNVEELARLLTDPTAGREFARLAQARSGSNQVGSIIRLVGLAQRSPSPSGNPKK